MTIDGVNGVGTDVLRAFGVRGPARALDGGQGTSWAAGGLVLKPEAGPVQEWLGEVLDGVRFDGIRFATPVRTVDGAWSHDGWSATRWLAGSAPDFSDVGTWHAIIAAGRAFHRAVAHLERPEVFDARQDRWAVADRVAWGERDVRFRPEFAALAARLRTVPPPSGPSQVVHLDLAGNVLFAPGLPPAVIDVSPYWRPPALAEGVIAADALCWHGATGSLGVPPGAVARALLFRMATTNERTDLSDAAVRDEARRYELAARSR